MCSVGHQVLTPRVWPREGGGRPQSWHLFLSTVLAFLLFIRKKRQIRQAKADWKRGRLVSTWAFVFHQPLLVAMPLDEENNYCYDTSNDAVIRMLSCGLLQCQQSAPSLLWTHWASRNFKRLFQSDGFTFIDPDICLALWLLWCVKVPQDLLSMWLKSSQEFIKNKTTKTRELSG